MNNYRQLTVDQRYTIEDMRAKGHSQKQIAAAIGVHPATVSRELRRNSGRYGYCGARADQKARRRRRQAGSRCRIDAQTWELVEQRLRLEHSPEQVSHWLQLRCGLSVSHTWIYRYVARDKRLGGDLYLHLRHGTKRRRKRYGRPDRRGLIPDRVGIEQRPAVVEQRCRIGDWEMDTVHGCRGGGAVVTMVERRSQYLLMRPVPSLRAEAVTAATVAALAPVRERVLTITTDNGKEMARHRQISEAVGAPVYFAHPYHAWERGLNEQVNGLVRQYFPKGENFRDVEPWQIEWVQERLNHRPRRSLGWRTPHEVFWGEADP